MNEPAEQGLSSLTIDVEPSDLIHTLLGLHLLAANTVRRWPKQVSSPDQYYSYRPLGREAGVEKGPFIIASLCVTYWHSNINSAPVLRRGIWLGGMGLSPQGTGYDRGNNDHVELACIGPEELFGQAIRPETRARCLLVVGCIPGPNHLVPLQLRLPLPSNPGAGPCRPKPELRPRK